MTLEMALLIFFGMAMIAGALIYFAIGVDRTATQVEGITQSPIGSFLLGVGQ